MTIEIKMPALSPTMEQGTLARWLVAEGDWIKTGDVLAEIETDKATMELEASDEGRVARFVVAEGTSAVKVGAVMALLDSTVDTNEDASARCDRAIPPQVEAVLPIGSSSHPAAVPVADQPVTIAPGCLDDASPLARKMAFAAGIDLGAVKGTGANGRIMRVDLPGLPNRSAVAQPTKAETQSQGPAIALPIPGIPARTEPLSSMRRTIASRLTHSKRTAPHFYLSVRCNIDPLLKLRLELNASLASLGIKLSVNDLLIKAFAAALSAVPEANVQFGGEELYVFERVDIAMAVAVDGGLLTPVIRDVGNLSVSAISEQSKSLVQRAREGRLRPDEYQGGTATLSNLGMFGVDTIVPVINPPQALIVGVAAGIQQPWNVSGELALATVMTATASFDHRAIDGADGARFITVFRDYVESPLRFVS